MLSSPRTILAALSLSVLGMVAIDVKPADAAVVCGPRGCVARPVARLGVAPVARLGGPVGVGRVGYGRAGVGYGRAGVGRAGYGVNRGGPVNRVGRR
ncbi:hypothetical protein OO17_15340 [Rhodopseudomonas palustris]|uniref:Uncharacterized protein n=1 Tax=Rhodopseudomonas palustris TaxID=1076 RepID=A0A0D7EPK5_RHOPL|nr:hypothetical protein OO17_15340 [Rhodopseudomonas palustris]